MGVPAFFRWLSRKYPSIVAHCVEERPQTVEGSKVPRPVDTSLPNPNNYEFDNLYLDMNGIIHPCTHPEDKPAPTNEAEMFVAIFEYMDRIFAIVRPRKVLYLAIDGVAPRAKMNQQRSRRFRAAKESREKAEEMSRLRADLTGKGIVLPPEKSASERFDSNCITPGTPFMARLSVALRYYIHDRLNSDPGWRNLKVILSDANVPGEGEHKIMDYIRRQRSQPDHDPNTKHCLCGADADLIMLGLATHEPHFTIIREEFVPNKPRPCELCGQLDHEAKDCVGLAAEPADKPPILEEQQFIFIRLHILREYLARELRMEGLPFTYDFERAIDDWVFMCFFVGNDFLPHLPSLEIRENAIDRLVNIYKKTVYQTGGWLTESGYVTLDRVQLIMRELGEMEDEIFKRRRDSDLNFRRRKSQNRGRGRGRGRGGRGRGMQHPMLRHDLAHPLGGGADMSRELGKLDSAQAILSMKRDSRGATAEEDERDVNRKRKADTMEPVEPAPDSDEEMDNRDEVKLYQDGWRTRYYNSKFGVDPDDDNGNFPVQVAHHYVRGLCWVLRYYYQGCASWNWYFPYHYAPFASDFINVADANIDFESIPTEPFKPLEQLMGVFPAASGSHVPITWRKLMEDPQSSIIDFYPVDFRVDLNGKKFAWMGVALLPFVDEKRLLKALQSVYPDLTEDEIARNVRGPDRIFMRVTNKGAPQIKALYEEGSQDQIPVDTKSSGGVGGVYNKDSQSFMVHEDVPSPVPQCADIPCCQVVSCCFQDPQFGKGFVFPSKILQGAEHPEATLKPEDHSGPWRPNLGMGADGGHRPRNSYDPSTMQRMVGHSMGAANYHNAHMRSHSGPYSARDLQPNQSRQDYVSIPPPSNYNRGGRGGSYHGPSYHQQNRGGGGGYSYNSGGYHQQQQPYHMQQQQYRGGHQRSHSAQSSYHQQRPHFNNNNNNNSRFRPY